MTAQDFSQLATEMMDELETAPLYLPSEFWRDINQTNMAMLWNQGIENFKRTIAQNYYNWLVHKSDDPQLRLPDKKIFQFRRFDSFSDIEDELAASHVGFFTSNQLEKFPAKFFDAMVTISTLPEMTKEQVDNFLNLFSEKARQAIYVKQWQHWKNPRDGTEMSMNDYALPSPDWQVSLDRKDPTNPMFFNRVWRRSAA